MLTRSDVAKMISKLSREELAALVLKLHFELSEQWALAHEQESMPDEDLGSFIDAAKRDIARAQEDVAALIALVSAPY